MKKSIFFLSFILLLVFACHKNSDVSSTLPQEQPVSVQEENASQRDICCCNIVISSTVFGGISICGVSTAGNTCSFSTVDCGKTCGREQIIAPPDKNAQFCVRTECPFCVTNLSNNLTIQFSFSCLSGGGGPYTLLPNETKCFMFDCNNGQFIPCTL